MMIFTPRKIGNSLGNKSYRIFSNRVIALELRFYRKDKMWHTILDIAFVEVDSDGGKNFFNNNREDITDFFSMSYFTWSDELFDHEYQLKEKQLLRHAIKMIFLSNELVGI